MNRKTNLLLILLAVAGLASGLVACSSNWEEWDQLEPPAAELEPGIIVTDPPPDQAYQTMVALEQLIVPQRDLPALAQRLRGVEAIPSIVRETPYEYVIGQEEQFWASNDDTNQNFQVTAVLQYITPHLYVWIEKGVDVDLEARGASAERFENQTYPPNRRIFGSEWSPGVDSDVHLNILHVRNLGAGVGGYYSSADEYSRLAHEYSNEREMFYVNLDGVSQGGDYYDGLLAHEFQHMIHWHTDRNETIWLNEGLSELAAHQNGYDPGLGDLPYLAKPDLQLTFFDYKVDGLAHYSQSYLFALYFLERFGEEAMRALVANKANGATGINAVLAQVAPGQTFETLFADWAAALYLDNPALDDGRYGYQSIDFRHPALAADLPAGPSTPTEASVHQFASDYIRVVGENPVTFVFTGTRQAPIVNTRAHSGEFFWWSNQQDESDTTLTRAFDFTGLPTATLEFWLWYDIEVDWDYAYLEVSADNGQTWEIIQTPHTTDHNPTGNGYGFGYTGLSGGGDAAEWIHESVDLGQYAGRPVLVRWEYITDDAFTRDGLALDDLSIPQLNYQDDFESPDPNWQAAGFIHHNNTLPQEFIVQLLTLGQPPSVQRLPLTEEGAGRWTIPLSPEMSEAILIISGSTPVTRKTAGYAYHLETD